MGASGSLRGSLATEWGGSIKPKERLPRATVLNSEPPLQATQNGLIPEACEPTPRPCKSTSQSVSMISSTTIAHRAVNRRTIWSMLYSRIASRIDVKVVASHPASTSKLIRSRTCSPGLNSLRERSRPARPSRSRRPPEARQQPHRSELVRPLVPDPRTAQPQRGTAQLACRCRRGPPPLAE